MNNRNRFIFSIVFFTLALSCKTSQKSIKIFSNITDNRIILRLAKDNLNRVITIQFPNKIEIMNDSFGEESFVMIDYIQGNFFRTRRNFRIELYTINKDILNPTSNNQKRTIPSKASLQYVFYTRHFVDSSKTSQEQFQSYVQEMLEENKDTLHIGTVSDFKKNHKELFERLTKNDSISVQFLDGNKFGEHITVPVEW